MSHLESVEAPSSWEDLRRLLRRWGIRDFAASLLEALGPLTILGAQLAYVGQPMLSSLINPEKFHEVVRLLDEPDQTKAFVAYLREGDPL